MILTVEAIYENGVLKPIQPLPLKEHEKVRITVAPERTWAERTAGMLQWTGDPEVPRRIADWNGFLSRQESCWRDIEELRELDYLIPGERPRTV